MTQIQDPKPQKEDIQARCLSLHRDFNVITRLASFFLSLRWEPRCSSLIIHLLNTPYVSGTILRALHVSDLIFPMTLQGKGSDYIYFADEERRSQQNR